MRLPGPHPVPADPVPADAVRERSRRGTVLALAGAAVLSVAAVATAVAWPSAAPRPATAGPTGDACLVGTWRVESYSEDVPLAGSGTVRFTGSGARTTLRADGTGETDYGTGTVYRATVNGRRVTLTISGNVRYRYRTRGGTLLVSDVVPAARSAVAVDGRAVTATPLHVNADPAGYTCAGTSMTQSTSAYRARYRRG